MDDLFSYLGIMLGILISFIGLVIACTSGPTEISWNQFVTKFLLRGQVQKIEVVNGSWARIYITNSNKLFWLGIGSVKSFETAVRREISERHLPTDLVFKSELHWKNVLSFITTIINLVPSLLCTFLLAAVVASLSTGQSATEKNNFQLRQSPQILNQNISIRFSDVIGCDQAKLEIMELINFIKNPEIYSEMGAKIPKGALLTGPPGTGKTLLAKAAAGEASVPFISVSGSEFNEIFIGMGSLKVRKLFETARENTPCIIFIDEIDSVGRKRLAVGNPGMSEEDNTLNQLLIEMDGFGSSDRVIVLAATNRADVLDAALLRPGRFDRIITVPLPEVQGRTELFKKYLAPLNIDGSLSKDLLAEKMSRLTPGFSGADISNVCNEAAILATRQNQCSVEITNFEAAIDRAVAGMENSGITLTSGERLNVAYHEAGHAVAGWFSQHASPLLKISIVPRGSSLGHTQFLNQDTHLYTEEQLLDLMVVMMGGRASEEIFFGKLSTGASDDLARVTHLAYQTVMSFGMSAKLGPMSYPHQGKYPMSEEFAKIIDSEVQLLVVKVEKMTTALLKSHRKEIKAIAEKLLEQNSLSQDEVVKLIGPRPFPEGDGNSVGLKSAKASEVHEGPVCGYLVDDAGDS